MEKAPRINVRITQEIKNILEDEKDKSGFVREAILYYSKHGPKTIESSTIGDSRREYRTISNNLGKKSEDSPSPKVRTYQPAWKR
jgi:hypothetical protein